MIISKPDFIKVFGEQGLSVTDKMYDNFFKYSELLTEWNQKINLTAITAPEDITYKHFLDSLLIFRYADIKKNASVIDVGTGAGFPGIPMKIYRRDIELTLMDSLNKRINFLKAVSEEINIKTDCVHSRAEDGGKNPQYREKFDIATARAVAAMPVLCEYCLPFVKQGGYFIALKGPGEDLSAAESAVNILGGKIEKITEYDLNGDGRTIAVIKKISRTPIKYPRNSSQIKAKHL